MSIEGSLSLDFAKLQSSNSTDGALPVNRHSATSPQSSDAGVITLGGYDGSTTEQGLLFQFFGTGADDATFQVRIQGWRRMGRNVNTQLWCPATLCEVTVQLSAGLPGVAGRLVVATEYFADELTINRGSGLIYESGAGQGPVQLLVPTLGCQFAKVLFAKGSATDCNALWTKLNAMPDTHAGSSGSVSSSTSSSFTDADDIVAGLASLLSVQEDMRAELMKIRSGWEIALEQPLEASSV